jgi:hypothetical protein
MEYARTSRRNRSSNVSETKLMAHACQNRAQNARCHGKPYAAMLRPSNFAMIAAASKMTNDSSRKVTPATAG